jgi:prevent-host-death family protein
MPSLLQVKTVTDLRERTVEVLAQLKNKGIFYIFSRSKPVAVLLSVEEYERLKNGYDLYTSQSSQAGSPAPSTQDSPSSLPETGDVVNESEKNGPDHWVEEMHIRREHGSS